MSSGSRNALSSGLIARMAGEAVTGDKFADLLSVPSPPPCGLTGPEGRASMGDEVSDGSDRDGARARGGGGSTVRSDF